MAETLMANPQSTVPATKQMDADCLEKLHLLSADCMQSLSLPSRQSDAELPVYQSLAGKRLMVVDDDAKVISTYIPHLLFACAGSATFHRYQGESLPVLVTAIRERQPEILLLDWNLNPRRSREINGQVVSATLIDLMPELTVVLFSSVPLERPSIRDAKAYAAVEKRLKDPKASVMELARVIGNRER